MNSKLIHELEYEEIPLFTSSQLRFLKEANSVIEDVIRNRAEKRNSLPDKSLVVKNFIDRVQVLENNFKIILNCLRCGESAKKKFLQAHPTWKKNREDSIQILKEISESINNDRFNCNVSKLVGYSTSFVGGTITVAGAVLTFATMGLAAPMVIAGAAVTGAGCSTAFGTSVTESVLLKNKVSKAKEVIENDRKYFEKMSDWLTHARELDEAIREVLRIDVTGNIIKDVKSLIDDAVNMANEYQRHVLIRRTIGFIFNNFPEAIRDAVPPATIGSFLALLVAFYLLFKNSKNRLLFDCASLTIRGFLGVASLLDDTMDMMRLASLCRGSTLAAKAVTRGAVAVVGMALDVAGIVLTSIDVHNGSLSPEAEKIANVSEELEKEARILDRVYNDLH